MATNQRKQDFVLGLATIGMLALFLGTILFLYPLFKTTGKRVEIHFPHTEGLAPLKPGSQVILGGSLTVGRVVEVKLQEVTPTPTAPDPVVFAVTAEIDRAVELFGDCKITSDQPAIGGNGFVSILDVGTPGVALQEPIHGLPPQSFAAAIGRLSQRILGPGGLLENLEQSVDPKREESITWKVAAILDDVRATTRQLSGQMQPQDEQALLHKLHGILDNIHTATAALRDEVQRDNNETALAKVHVALDELDKALREAAVLVTDARPVAQEALTHVANITRSFETEVLVQIRQEFDRDDPRSLVGKVHVAMDSLNATLSNTDLLTADAARFLAANRPALDEAVTNFKATSQELLHGIQELALDPSRILFGPGPERKAQLRIYQAARQFATAATRLDDAAGRLEAVLKVVPAGEALSPADVEELKGLHEALRASFQRFSQTENLLWDEMK